jgi:hypothetical protein
MIYDYSLVLHELQLNSWALACRRLLGERLLRWEGATDIAPPPSARQDQGRLGDYWSVKGLRLPQPRLLRPDTTLEFTTDLNALSQTITLLVGRKHRLGRLRADRYRSFVRE